MTPEAQLALVEAANRAPSVHNIQPTRFRFEQNGEITLIEDRRRRLWVGDPLGADNQKSLGAAAEGLVLALSEQGLGAQVTMAPATDREPLREAARITLAGPASPDNLARYAAARATYRGVFTKPSESSALKALAGACPDLLLIEAPADIARIGDHFDDASMQVLRNDAYRLELVSWMRLSRSDPNYRRDGLSAEHMALSAFEAAGARAAMGNLFPHLDRIGVARPLISESAKVKSAAAIGLFHRPADEPEFETGRRFYRVWLESERCGLALCPMSVLADVSEAASTLTREYGVDLSRKLVTVFRLGARPNSYVQPPRARLPAHELIA